MKRNFKEEKGILHWKNLALIEVSDFTGLYVVNAVKR